MKKNLITLRVEPELKENFKKVCRNERIGMSDKLHGFIYDEVGSKLEVTLEDKVETLLKVLGYENIRIVDRPISEINNRVRTVETIEFKNDFTFNDFLNENKNNIIYIYLLGSNLPERLRVFTIVLNYKANQ